MRPKTRKQTSDGKCDTELRPSGMILPREVPSPFWRNAGSAHLFYLFACFPTLSHHQTQLSWVYWGFSICRSIVEAHGDGCGNRQMEGPCCVTLQFVCPFIGGEGESITKAPNTRVNLHSATKEPMTNRLLWSTRRSIECRRAIGNLFKSVGGLEESGCAEATLRA